MLSAMTHTTNTTTSYGVDDTQSNKPISTAVGKPDPSKKNKQQAYEVPLFDFEKAESDIVIPEAKEVSEISFFGQKCMLVSSRAFGNEKFRK